MLVISYHSNSMKPDRRTGVTFTLIPVLTDSEDSMESIVSIYNLSTESV